MATRTTVAIQDDLAGGPAEQTVQFGLDGADYEIDLNAENAADFRRQLAPFLDHARIASARERRPARTVASRVRSSRIRAWARDQGIQVSDRGRLPASVTKRYEGVSSGMLTSAGDKADHLAREDHERGLSPLGGSVFRVPVPGRSRVRPVMTTRSGIAAAAA